VVADLALSVTRAARLEVAALLRAAAAVSELIATI
jgi:hypothetical protein